jgi:peptidylprolyl isomerase
MKKKKTPSRARQKAAVILIAFSFLMVSVLIAGNQQDKTIFDSNSDSNTFSGINNVNNASTDQTGIQKAEFGNTVEINFIGRFEDGTIFDSTYEDVGRNAGLNKKEYGPMEFVVGYGQALEGLIEAVEGMAEGEEKNVAIPPEKAFGLRNENLVQDLPLAMFAEIEDLSVGAVVSSDDKSAWVVKIGDDVVTLDFNHPFAGATLFYTIRLESVYKTSFDVSSVQPVILKYFWSPYCGYCKIQDPMLHEFMQEHPSLSLIVIDITREENTFETVRYRVTGTPTFVLKKGGLELIAGGLLSKEQLTEYICPKLQDEMCLTGEIGERRNVTKWW